MSYRSCSLKVVRFQWRVSTNQLETDHGSLITAAVQNLMQETIHAAHNLTIQLDPTAWRLFNGAQSSGKMIALLEARSNGIRVAPVFARARQLPGDGRLVPADVARVVLGWAPESRNWHLGLMLAARPETNFHTRWCGLASWPSGVAGEYMESAKRAGQVLARIIDRPFHLVPPAEPVRVAIDDTQPLQATVQIEAASVREAALHAVQLKAPPLEFDEWTLVAVPRGLIWQRRGRWVMLSAARAIGLAVLSVLFLLLGIGAQTRGLADVKPSWLPWLGIAVAGALVAVAFANIGAMLAASDVMIDTARREVRHRSRLLGTVRWRLPFDSTAYVLVSQTPPRPEGHPRADEPMATAQEVWLHLYDGHRFWPVVELGRVEGRCQDWDNVRHRLKTPGRRALKLAYFDTPAHHAAQVMAQALNVDVWLDVRS